MKEKAVVLLVAFAIRCMFPSARHTWDRCADRGENTTGESYDGALNALIELLKSEKATSD